VPRSPSIHPAERQGQGERSRLGEEPRRKIPKELEKLNKTPARRPPQ
jgi:hypothetical protein